MRAFELALKAAGDATRARILKLLERGPLCVCQVQAVLGLATSTVSKHLTVLRAADLVEARRDGKWVAYALSAEAENPHARAVLGLLRGPLDRDPVVAEDRRRLKLVLRIPTTELCAMPPGRLAAAIAVGRPAAHGRRAVHG